MQITSVPTVTEGVEVRKGLRPNQPIYVNDLERLTQSEKSG